MEHYVIPGGQIQAACEQVSSLSSCKRLDAALPALGCSTARKKTEVALSYDSLPPFFVIRRKGEFY